MTQTRILPQTLRAARMPRGLTPQERAARIGVRQSTISFWKKVTEMPTIEHVILLALELSEIADSLEARELLPRRSELEHALRGVAPV